MLQPNLSNVSSCVKTLPAVRRLRRCTRIRVYAAAHPYGERVLILWCVPTVQTVVLRLEVPVWQVRRECDVHEMVRSLAARPVELGRSRADRSDDVGVARLAERRVEDVGHPKVGG